MPSSIPAPNRRIPLEVLTPANFSEFGTVIQNPVHSSSSFPTPPQHVTENQGTAQKYLDVTHMTNFYHLSPSKRLAKPVMNMFSCSPRQLRQESHATTVEEPEWSTVYEDRQLFDVEILERHPFTPQTFIPLGHASTDPSSYYLVIVAPTLQTSRRRKLGELRPPYPTDKPRRRRSLLDVFSRARPSPFDNDLSVPKPSPSKGSRLPKGPGLPDLTRLRAFIATGNQAVTYGAGTWHAPMVVLGEKLIDFVVVQYSNNVASEDCQEVLLQSDGDGTVVELESTLASSMLKAKL